MNCERAKSQLALLLYGELSFEDEERLQGHLDGCAVCRDALEQERLIFRMLDSGNEELPVGLLNQCRTELSSRLTSEPAEKPPFWNRVRDFFSDVRLAPARIVGPVGALALLAIGFGAGRVIPWASQSGGGYVEARGTVLGPMFTAASNAAPAVAARVRQVEAGADGQLQIVIDETRQRVVTGRPDDDSIRRLLLAAATDSADPGVRGETVEILRNGAPSDETRRALLYALEHDPNDGVRLRALDGLKDYAKLPEVRRAFTRALVQDVNAGIRTQAIDVLTSSPGGPGSEQRLVGACQAVMGRESNSYIRSQCQRSLKQFKASEVMY